ncbi:MAG: hypothetical protein IT580_11715 [Verrucomicrobiales bacterium]|nr:hypothetical protein [Verrucomicrobiales bacterium]
MKPTRNIHAHRWLKRLGFAPLVAALTAFCGQPYMDEPFSVPGTLEYEHFDRNGGDSDLDGVRNHVYRDSNADLISCTDQGGGFALSNAANGEYVEHSIRVTTPGPYQLEVRAKSSNYAPTLKFEILNAGGSVIASTTHVLTYQSGTWYNYYPSATLYITTAGDYRLRTTWFAGVYPGAGDALNYVSLYLRPPNPSYGSTNLVLTGLTAGEPADEATRRQVAYNNAQVLQTALNNLGNAGGGELTLPAGTFLLSQANGSGLPVDWSTPNNAAVHITKHYLKIKGATTGGGTKLKALFRSTILLWVGVIDNGATQSGVPVSNFTLENVVLIGNPRFKTSATVPYTDGSTANPPNVSSLPSVPWGGANNSREGIIYDYAYAPDGPTGNIVWNWHDHDGSAGSLLVANGTSAGANPGYTTQIAVRNCRFVNPSIRGISMMKVRDVVVTNCAFRFFDNVLPEGDPGIVPALFDNRWPELGAHVGIRAGAALPAENLHIVNNGFDGNLQMTTTAATGGYAADGLVWVPNGGNIRIAGNAITNYGLEGIQVNCGPTTLVRNKFISNSSCAGAIASVLHPNIVEASYQGPGSIYASSTCVANTISGGTGAFISFQFPANRARYNLSISANTFTPLCDPIYPNWMGNYAGSVFFTGNRYQTISPSQPLSGDYFAAIYHPTRLLLSGNVVDKVGVGVYVGNQPISDSLGKLWLLSNTIKANQHPTILINETYSLISQMTLDGNYLSKGPGTSHLYLKSSKGLLDASGTAPNAGRLALNDQRDFLSSTAEYGTTWREASSAGGCQSTVVTMARNLARSATQDRFRLFWDDFQYGLDQWTGKSGGAHSGFAANCPAGSTALAFGQLQTGGDVFSKQAVTLQPSVLADPDEVKLRFKYYGYQGAGGVPGNIGGFAGLSFTTNPFEGHGWVAGTDYSAVGGLYIPATELLDGLGTWTTYEIPLNSLVPSFSRRDWHLMFEDWVGSNGVPGDAYFDDVEVVVRP